MKVKGWFSRFAKSEAEFSIPQWQGRSSWNEPRTVNALLTFLNALGDIPLTRLALWVYRFSCKQQIAADPEQHPPHPRSLFRVGGVIFSRRIQKLTAQASVTGHVKRDLARSARRGDDDCGDHQSTC